MEKINSRKSVVQLLQEAGFSPEEIKHALKDAYAIQAGVSDALINRDWAIFTQAITANDTYTHMRAFIPVGFYLTSDLLFRQTPILVGNATDKTWQGLSLFTTFSDDIKTLQISYGSPQFVYDSITGDGQIFIGPVDSSISPYGGIGAQSPHAASCRFIPSNYWDALWGLRVLKFFNNLHGDCVLVGAYKNQD